VFIKLFLKMLSKFKLFGVLFALTFVACEKDNVKTDSEKYQLEVRSVELQSLSSDLEDIWEWALSEYGLGTICGCGCEDAELVPGIWEEGKVYLPEWIQGTEIWQDSCQDIQPIYKRICLVASQEAAINAVKDEMATVGYLSSAEKYFIRGIINEALNETLDTSEMISDWLSLPPDSITNNEISLMIVETIISVKVFIDSHPTEFPDGPSALVNKIIGTLGGGIFGVLADCTEDIYCDTGYASGEDGPWGDFKSSFIKGAIGGALFAL
jgi:hypothetical protein